MGGGKGKAIVKSVLRKTLSRQRAVPYGALTQTHTLIEEVGKAAFLQAAERAAQIISTAVAPQFAMPIWTGYHVWKYGEQACKEFESMEGTIEDKTAMFAARQAYKVVINELASRTIGRSMGRAIDTAVLEASSYLSLSLIHI